MRSRRRQRALGSWLIHAAALLLTVLILAPIIWMGLMSVSSTNDLTSVPLHWIPADWDFSRYVKLVTIAENSTGAAFTASLRNSLVVATVGAVIALLASVPAAWAVSRMPNRFSWILHVSVATYMLPPVSLVVPMYFALSAFGALNNVFSLAIIYLSILAPFTAWLLKSNFDNVPIEIEQAAMMDGANLFQIMRSITLPLAAPGLATAGLFALLQAWDEFFYALLFTSDQRAKTLTVAIADLAGGRIADYGLIAAAGIIAALPPVAIGFGLQKALISGLTTGGVKG
ncbi:MAG TPA: carbohydrate ABC transporter permease [Dongiaceae bacterium]|jgi:multiple sugar transport system permease protein|nr:carbohydrate ABC transporter permease [Dongiaceae bacterium]